MPGTLVCEVLIDADAAAIVGLDPDFGEAEALGVGHAAHRHEHDVAFEGLGLAALCGFERELQALAVAVHIHDLGAKLEGEALLLEHALELLRHLAVEAGRDARQHLDHGDL